MISKKLVIFLQPLRIDLLDGLTDLLMNFPSPLQEQTVVCHLLREGVLEDVFQLREELLLVNQLQTLKIEERSLEVFLHTCNRRQNTIGKLPPDNRGNLYDLFELVINPIHTCGDDSLYAIWHLDL